MCYIRLKFKINLTLNFSTCYLPSHVSSPHIRITFQLHMARYKFYIVLYCIVLYCYLCRLKSYYIFNEYTHIAATSSGVYTNPFSPTLWFLSWSVTDCNNKSSKPANDSWFSWKKNNVNIRMWNDVMCRVSQCWCYRLLMCAMWVCVS